MQECDLIPARNEKNKTSIDAGIENSLWNRRRLDLVESGEFILPFGSAVSSVSSSLEETETNEVNM